MEWCSWSKHSVQPKTCSDRCLAELRAFLASKGESFKCQSCGCSFFRKKRGKDDRRFCSRDCAAANKSRVAQQQKAEKRAAIELQNAKQCAVCCKTFIGKYGSKYCSAKCRPLPGCTVNKFQRIKQCAICAEPFEVAPIPGIQSYCSEPCKLIGSTAKLKALRMAAKARRRGCRKVSFVAARLIWKRDQGLCGICGDPVKVAVSPNHPKALEFDHIIPISKGGAHVVENLQLSCRSCNGWKSDKDLQIGGVLAT